MADTLDSAKKACVMIAKISWWTIIDEFRQRSVIVFFIVCAAFMFLIRGCYKGSYVVNGKALDAATVAWNVSQATFHVVAAGVMIIAALMAMRIFRRERDDGTQAYLLSRPVARRHYCAGKVAGLWLATTASMLVLHGVIFLITFMNAHAVIPGYLTASLLCSVNLLFVVLAVMALSLFVPDMIAFLVAAGIGAVCFIGQGVEAAAHLPMVQAAVRQSGAQTAQGLTWWKAVWALWPKVGGLQAAASSLIGSESFSAAALIGPLANVIVYCGILGALCYAGFLREEIV